VQRVCASQRRSGRGQSVGRSVGRLERTDGQAGGSDRRSHDRMSNGPFITGVLAWDDCKPGTLLCSRTALPTCAMCILHKLHVFSCMSAEKRLSLSADHKAILWLVLGSD